MSDCGFEDQLSNGMKAGILGLILGALAWFVVGEKKHGTKGYDPKPTTPKKEKPITMTEKAD